MKYVTIEQMKRIDADYLANHFDEALELCYKEMIICIEQNGKPDLVMMSKQAYEDWAGETLVLPDSYGNE